jgi:hypothetical protein
LAAWATIEAFCLLAVGMLGIVLRTIGSVASFLWEVIENQF